MLSTSQKIDGWCTSLRVLVHMVSTPLVGALADRHGRLRMVFLSVAVTTGCALVFCGELTHGALPVTDGRRAVFVASFGPRGEDYRHVSRRPRSVRLVGALRRALARAWS